MKKELKKMDSKELADFLELPNTKREIHKRKKVKLKKLKKIELSDINKEQDAVIREDIIPQLGENPDKVEVDIFKALYDGLIKKFKYEQEKGLYVLKSEVEDDAFTLARTVRNKLLTIPERISAELSSMNNTHEIKEYLYKELNTVLEELSDGV